MASTNEERAMAMQDLIDRILVTRESHPEAYRRIHLHYRYLRAWFMDRPRWRVLAGAGSYRLEKLPCQVLPERGLPRLRTPLDYACLCWTLGFAELQAANAEKWFLLSDLAAAVTRAGDGLFSLAERDHREALVRALGLLEDLELLVCHDGDTGPWVGQEEGADVLYEFAPQTPRLLADFDRRATDALKDANFGGRTLPWTGEQALPRARVWRSLLLGPGLWRADDPEAFAVLTAEEELFRSELESPLGWELEVEADYARIWRPGAARGAAGVLVDLVEGREERRLKFIFHPVLLLLARIREELAEGQLVAEADGSVTVTADALREGLRELRRQHRERWGAELGEMGLDELARQVLRQLREMGYLRGPDALGRCWLLPPAAMMIGRYTCEPLEPESAELALAQETLFGGVAEP